MELEKAKAIAERLKALLEPVCERVEVAGSIRRQKPQVGNIEFLVIPKGNMLDKLLYDLMMENILAVRLNKRGSRVYGPKNKLMVHIPSSIGVDVFSTIPECWPVGLVVRTGGERIKKEIAYRALERGMRFRAYGSGFDTPDGHLQCKSEQEVFQAVGLRYLEPEERK